MWWHFSHLPRKCKAKRALNGKKRRDFWKTIRGKAPGVGGGRGVHFALPVHPFPSFSLYVNSALFPHLRKKKKKKKTSSLWVSKLLFIWRKPGARVGIRSPSGHWVISPGDSIQLQRLTNYKRFRPSEIAGFFFSVDVGMGKSRKDGKDKCFMQVESINHWSSLTWHITSDKVICLCCIFFLLEAPRNVSN